MRVLNSLVPSLLLLASHVAAASWGFQDATLSIVASSKKAAAGASFKEKFSQTSPVGKPATVSNTDTIKVLLTATEDGKPKRPHQAFVVLTDQATGLEAPFPMTVKDNGKAVVEIKYADLPIMHAASPSPLKASLVLASFGASAEGVAGVPVADITVFNNPQAGPIPIYLPAQRYGRRDEIHHIFRDDPRSPPVVFSLIFLAAIAAAVPAVFIAWAALGGNLGHLGSGSPVSHAAFFGSLIALEGVFALYYASWNLFQTLPVVAAVGGVTFLAGTKALGEVQQRRLAGRR